MSGGRGTNRRRGPDPERRASLAFLCHCEDARRGGALTSPTSGSQVYTSEDFPPTTSLEAHDAFRADAACLPHALVRDALVAPSPSALVAGPTLASRYLVPALVDCLGRLSVAAAAEASSASGSTGLIPSDPPHPFHPLLRSPGPSTSPYPTSPTTRRAKPGSCGCSPDHEVGHASAGGHDSADRSGHGGGSGASRGRCREGDPASHALALECRRRRRRREGIGGHGDPADRGVGCESGALLISRALADLCLMVSS